MTLFSYIAINGSEKPVNGTIDQPDRAGVISELKKQNLRPISINEAKKKSAGIDLNNLFGGNKVKSDQLVMFTRQLSAMVGAGVPLIRALTALADHINGDTSVLKKILIDVIKQVEGGVMLSTAIAKYPNTFNDVYVNMVRAGETAGILDEILRRLALQQEKSSKLRKKVKSSMAYPLVLITITVLAFFGLMLFVVPQIGKVLKELGGQDAKLPDITLFMLAISDAFTSYWYIIFPALAGIVFAIWRYIKTEKGKYQLHYLMLKTPIVKTIVMKIAIAHFARTFSALIEAGVGVLEALSVTSKAVGNDMYKNALVEAEAEVKNGKTLSAYTAANPLFPAIVPQMLSVGEETGQTDKVLVKVAEFYEEEVDIAIEGLSTIIEPIMIVIMGSMVGLIAAAVMLPIASLSSSIK